MIETLFPTGIWQFLLGGLFIGSATSLIYLTTGIYGGVSSTLSALWSYFSDATYFTALKETRARKVLLMLGIVSGALLYTISTGYLPSVETPLWRLFLGGILVGIGTRLGRGCTSGHGVCGISALNPHSIKAVLTFMGIAILTALLVGGLL